MDQNRSTDQGQQGTRDQDSPNQNANKEPAEGSRETVRGNQGQGPQGGQDTGRNEYPRTEGEQGGGITNRPLDRELEEQSQVPPRGRTKDEEQGNA